jgi:hypothetical protein
MYPNKKNNSKAIPLSSAPRRVTFIPLFQKITFNRISHQHTCCHTYNSGHDKIGIRLVVQIVLNNKLYKQEVNKGMYNVDGIGAIANPAY